MPQVETPGSFLKHARDVIVQEGEAILKLADQLDDSFDQALRLILACRTKLILTGIGKSGLIGRKIAATLASTGTPCSYLHPAEALHGDLGMVTPGDVIIAISYSGETNELLQLVPFFQDNGNPLIALTGNPSSTLARHAAICLLAQVEQEACPHDLAPTTSSTAALVLGDALAVTLMHARNFLPEEFARFHPGGSLGMRLLTRVQTVMRTHDLPTISPDTKLAEVVHQISLGRLGLVAILHPDASLAGIITDGDIRRAMETHRAGFFDLIAQDIMTASPICIAPDTRLAEAEKIMLDRKINALLVTMEDKLIGVLQIYQIPGY